MKIYKVHRMIVNYGRSLTPTLGGSVRPPTPAVLAGFTSYGFAYRKMLALGYSDPQIMIMFQRWFTHNTASMGLTARQAWNCVLSDVNVLCEPPPAPWIPGPVLYTVGVIAILLVAKALLSPMDFYQLTIRADSTMYAFANDEWVTFGELLAVSPGGRGLYEKCGEVGGPLIALAKNRDFPPDELDQMWFGGTVMWKGWHFPYFRRYYHMYWWVEYLDVADWQGGSRYYLKHNAVDANLPPAPYIRPGGPWGSTTYTGIYDDFPWNLVL